MRTPENYTEGLKLFNHLYALLGRDGGFSLNINDESPSTGYMVSIKDGPVFDALEHVRSKEVLDFIAENEHAFNWDHHYIGGWVDQKTGKVYIDIAINLQSLDSAIAVARAAKELAIYNVDENHVAYLSQEEE